MINQLFATPLTVTSSSIDQQTPNIDASLMFDTHRMILGNNIKNLIILIPNEAHESPALPEEQRLINQPYVPQHAVVNTGTAIAWFNADVDHDHKITLVGGQDSSIDTSNVVFESGDFAYNTASKFITFNNTGTFGYFEEDVIEDDPIFVMNGTINVVDQLNSLTTTTNDTTDGSAISIDTIGTLMVPTMDLPNHTSVLENRGFSILSTHNFKDLRGGQQGTGDEQTLIVWGISNTDMSNIISQLSEITSDLPYS